METETRKVLLGGACEVGKSQMVTWFRDKEAREEYYPTDEQRLECAYELTDSCFELTILDTGGDRDYDEFIKDWVEEADAYMFVFSVDDEDSTKKLHLFKDSLPVEPNNGSKHHIVLVGNSPSGLPEKRLIPKAAGISLAADLFGPHCVYIETTTRQTAEGADPKVSVQAAFDAIVEQMFPGQTKAANSSHTSTDTQAVPGDNQDVLGLISSLQDEISQERAERLKDQKRFNAAMDTEREERQNILDALDTERAERQKISDALDTERAKRELFAEQLASIMASMTQLGLDHHQAALDTDRAERREDKEKFEELITTQLGMDNIEKRTGGSRLERSSGARHLLKLIN